MKKSKSILPTVVTALLLVAGVIHGPIAQLPDYHEFADQTQRFGIAHFADVTSNLGFLLVAVWGWLALSPVSKHPALASGWCAYRLFLLGLALTACGSAWYHFAPDNARLIWDRIPITLACGGLLAGAWGDAHRRSGCKFAIACAIFGLASVAWWYATEQTGNGDLRPYLAMQILPLLLVPVWQSVYDAPKSDRWFFSAALIIYAVAKLAEINDREIGAILGITGHTLKHLLATLSSALIVIGLRHRVRTIPRVTPVTVAASAVK